MANEWFKEWFDTPYYHQLYYQRDNNEANLFVQRLMQHLQPKDGSIILDVACGTGRHCQQLVQMGFDVTGIDLSHASIKKAKAYENERLHFYQHDMRQPFRINYFDYAFNFFTSFGYFNTLREHNAALRTIARSLRLNGILVIDYLNAQYEAKHLVAKAAVDSGSYHFKITKRIDESHFYKKIEVQHASFTGTHVFEEKVARFSLENFKEMLALQGMEITEVFGDYNLSAYHEMESPRMIMVAKKIKNN